MLLCLVSLSFYGHTVRVAAVPVIYMAAILEQLNPELIVTEAGVTSVMLRVLGPSIAQSVSWVAAAWSTEESWVNSQQR